MGTALIVVASAAISFLAVLALDVTTTRHAVSKRFGIDLGWREATSDRLAWNARLRALRSLAMDAAEFRKWSDAGRPEDWPFAPADICEPDEPEADAWVQRWIEENPKNAARVGIEVPP